MYNKDGIIANIHDKLFGNTQFKKFYNKMIKDIDYHFVNGLKGIMCFTLDGKYYKLELKEIDQKEMEEI